MIEFLGITITVWVAIVIIWFFLNLIANWKLLSKAGKGGWQSIIPIWNNIARYGISWSKMIGFIVTIAIPLVLGYYSKAYNAGSNLPSWASTAAFIAGVFATICYVVEKFKLSRAFGHGFFFGLGLLILEPLFIMILAFGHSEYIEKR